LFLTCYPKESIFVVGGFLGFVVGATSFLQAAQVAEKANNAKINFFISVENNLFPSKRK